MKIVIVEDEPPACEKLAAVSVEDGTGDSIRMGQLGGHRQRPQGFSLARSRPRRRIFPIRSSMQRQLR